MTVVRLEEEGGVGTLTLDRPEKRNAINWVMWNELIAVLDSVEGSDSIRVLVVRGAGGSFCSGADLSGGAPPIHPLREMELINRVVVRLHRLTKLTIALVDGDAVGAGCNLALACDLVAATDRSRFAEIFVRRGMSIDCGGSWILPRLVGLQKAKELCLMGDLVPAADAIAIGLVNACGTPDAIEATVRVWTEKLLSGAPIAQALTKRLLNQGMESGLETALDNEAAAQLVNLAGADAGEARRAFVDHRDARFTGAWSTPR
jgi:enoyl-CoA hydratase/carnithine racemase